MTLGSIVYIFYRQPMTAYDKLNVLYAFLIVGGTFITIHELLHYIPAKFYGYNPNLNFKSVEVKEEMKTKHFMVILLTPVVFTFILYLTGFVISLFVYKPISIVFILAVAVVISGSTKDMYCAYLVHRYRHLNKTGTIKMVG